MKNQEKRREEKRLETIVKEMMSESFSSQEKDKNIQVQEVKRSPVTCRLKSSLPKHVLIKSPKSKHEKKILKTAKHKKSVPFMENSVWLSVDLRRNLTALERVG